MTGDRQLGWEGEASAVNIFRPPRSYLRQKVGKCQTAWLAAQPSGPASPDPQALLQFVASLQSPTFWRTWLRRDGDPLGGSPRCVETTCRMDREVGSGPSAFATWWSSHVPLRTHHRISSASKLFALKGQP